MLEQFATQNYGSYYNPMYPGMQYAQYKRPSMSQPLTAEQIQLLASKGGNFSTRVSAEDLLRSYCTHKRDGNIVLNNNGDGTFTCPICQETFADTDLDQQHVKEATKEMINILQMIKTTYIDIPDATAIDFFPIIKLLEKTPELAEIAMRNFAQYEQGPMIQNANAPYSFGALNNLMGGQGMGYPQQMVQPMYPQQMYAPQQQMMAPAMYPQQQQQQMVQPQQQMVQPGFTPINEFGSYAPQPMVQPLQNIQYQAQQQQMAPAMYPQQQMIQPQQQMVQPPMAPAQVQVTPQNNAGAPPATVDVSAFQL